MLYITNNNTISKLILLKKKTNHEMRTCEAGKRINKMDNISMRKCIIGNGVHANDKMMKGEKE